MAERRSSKRRRSSSIDSIPSLDNGEDGLRDFLPAFSSFIGFGMPQLLGCVGCLEFSDSVGLLIDFRGHDALMAAALAKRNKSGPRKQCLQLWCKPFDHLHTHEHKRMWKMQRAFITERGHDPDRPVSIPSVTAITPGTISTAAASSSTQDPQTTPRLPAFQNPPWQSPRASSTANPSTVTAPSTANLRTVSRRSDKRIERQASAPSSNILGHKRKEQPDSSDCSRNQDGLMRLMP